MAQNLNIPVRMCVVCRSRLPQHTLLRLQCHNKTLTRFSGRGRSFYLCASCFEHKKLPRVLARECKCSHTDILLIQLKEIIVDVR